MQCCVSCLSKRKLDGSLQIQEFSYQQFSFQKFSHLEFSLQKFSNLEFSLQQLSNLQYICASNFLTCNEIVLPIFTPATKKFLQFIKIKFFQLSILQLISHPIFAHLIFPHPHKIPPIFMIPFSVMQHRIQQQGRYSLCKKKYFLSIDIYWIQVDPFTSWRSVRIPSRDKILHFAVSNITTEACLSH